MRKQRSVSDLGCAAYILMHKFKVMGRNGKDIYFQLNETNTSEKFDQLTLDYLSSEFHRFDACIMSLKKIGEYQFDTKTNRFVTDLGAAAYILMHKYKLIGKKGKAIYFEVEDDVEDKFDEIENFETEKKDKKRYKPDEEEDYDFLTFEGKNGEFAKGPNIEINLS
mgnify:CR=1 FL=1